ncbi:hypothetical protein F5Y16DRAFT_61171 [Xylariaceae sp. FL0255]|nr:hypothetical protein F5Y16DRAFT_61171 [Xylariaceae sp. FL0255]
MEFEVFQDTFPTVRSHQVLRAVAVAANIVTARHLFANGFHYPYIMLLAHAGIVVFIEICCDWGRAGNRQENSQQGRLDIKRMIWQLLFSVSIALGLTWTYQALLHNRNTTLWLMILALDWAVVLERVVVCRTHRDEKQRSLDAPLSVFTFLICVGMIICYENALTGSALSQLFSAALFMTAARNMWRRGLVESSFDIGSLRMDSYVAGIAVCIPMTIIPIFAFAPWRRVDFHTEGRLLWILLSLFVGTLSLLSDRTLKKLTSIIQNRITATTSMDHDFGSHLFFMLVLAAVEVDNSLFQHRPSITRAAQWLAFAIASLTTVNVEWIPLSGFRTSPPPLYTQIPILKAATAPSDEMIEDPESFLPLGGHPADEAAWFHRVSLIWQSILSSLTLLLILSCAMNRAEPIPHPPAPDLDIVIAWYDEPVERVISTARLAIDLPSLAGRRTRTIVYNKGFENGSDVQELRSAFPKSETAELVIRQLENVGREGETYLTHVLRSGNDTEKASSHTIFLQTEPHEPMYLEKRLKDYFVAETGFLSLSYARNYCHSCNDCNDHAGWSLDSETLHYIFASSMGRNQTCRDISLTYRGQFVVSAKRMARANRELFEEARTRLLKDVDFGFSLERLWGVLFQCPRQSARCPSLLSGWLGNVAEMDDCQCLDDDFNE